MPTRSRQKKAAPFRIRASIGSSMFDGEGPRAAVMVAYQGWVVAVLEVNSLIDSEHDGEGDLDELDVSQSTAH